MGTRPVGKCMNSSLAKPNFLISSAWKRSIQPLNDCRLETTIVAEIGHREIVYPSKCGKSKYTIEKNAVKNLGELSIIMI